MGISLKNTNLGSSFRLHILINFFKLSFKNRNNIPFNVLDYKSAKKMDVSFIKTN